MQEIEFTLSPNSEDLNFLTKQINNETIGDIRYSAYPFAFFIKNDLNETIAGCNGSVIFGAIYTDQLWVHLKYRKMGLGKRLMQKVHDYGRSVGCTMSTVATMSFQKAKEFYEHLGYICDFERNGYANNANCIFLKKLLY